MDWACVKIRGAGQVLACARPALGRLAMACYLWHTGKYYDVNTAALRFLLGGDLSDVEGRKAWSWRFLEGLAQRTIRGCGCQTARRAKPVPVVGVGMATLAP